MGWLSRRGPLRDAMERDDWWVSRSKNPTVPGLVFSPTSRAHNPSKTGAFRARRFRFHPRGARQPALSVPCDPTAECRVTNYVLRPQHRGSRANLCASVLRRQPLVLRNRTCSGQLKEVVEVGDEPHRCVWASVKGELQLDTAVTRGPAYRERRKFNDTSRFGRGRPQR